MRPSVLSPANSLLLTSFLCPLRVYISFMALMSYTLIRWSRDAVSSQFPFLFQFTDITVALWAWLHVQKGEDTKLCVGEKHQIIESKTML